MLKKIVVTLYLIIGTYVLHFPFRLFEDWIMGEVLERVENNGLSFFILWILPLLAAIGLVAIAIRAWNFVEALKNKAACEYQPKSSGTIIGVAVTASAIVGKADGLKYELNTNNKKNRLLEAKVAIQAMRFIKPTEIVVRPDYLPVIIECEKAFWKRFRNKLLFVPRPRIIVKRFTEKGIIWDEENTTGADITIEFYSK